VAESSPDVYEAVREKFADVLADRPPARIHR